MSDIIGRATGNRLATLRGALPAPQGRPCDVSDNVLQGNKACKRRTHAMETTSGLAQYSAHSLDPAPPPYARSHVVHDGSNRCAAQLLHTG